MSEVPGTDMHGNAEIKPYLVIFGALTIFTFLSFFVNYFARENYIAVHTAFALILGIAICKAALVGMFFMHLKFDWPRLYFLIIPVFILGTMMVIVLLPDIVLAWHHS